MAELDLGDGGSLHYEWDAPQPGRPSFVFVNALTGSTAMWQGEIAPALRADGFGTLAWNFRGQEHSTYAPGTALTPELIVADLRRVLEAVAPPDPVLVGLSIGGLFALQAHLQGPAARALVLINTLRAPGLRLDWINEATFRAARLGGPGLLMDMYLPMLVNPDLLSAMRADRLGDAPYAPLDPDSGAYQLLMHARGADWDVPYEQVAVPVLVMSGLQDRVFLVPHDVAALTARLPDARTVEVPDAGHLIPVERPQATIAALRDFAGGLA